MDKSLKSYNIEQSELQMRVKGNDVAIANHASLVRNDEKTFPLSGEGARKAGEGKKFAQQTETSLPSYRPNVLTTSNKLDCFARPADGGNGARNDVTTLVPQYLSALVPSKKAALTLAEVLITLGIIGVVAAMTMPTLIQNHKKQVWVNQLKKSVSTLEQGFQKMLADDGVDKLTDTSIFSNAGACIPSDYNIDSECTKFYNDLKNYFQISDISYVDNFWGKFLWTDDKDDISENYLKFVDGTFVLLALPYFHYGNTAAFNDAKIGAVTIDINGFKKPNTYCRDNFSFYLLNNGHLEPLFQAEKFKHYPGGDGCEAYLMQNGWVMDY